MHKELIQFGILVIQYFDKYQNVQFLKSNLYNFSIV